MTWFAELFGFPESAKNISRHISVDGSRMHSAANGRTFTAGTLTTPSLAELRDAAEAATSAVAGSIRVREVIADAGALHTDPANAGALFQVASQFNLLEMVSPDVTPDRGITGYIGDKTQGPACAMACAAGTLARNWLAQSTKEQIDTIAEVGDDIGNDPNWRGRGLFWTMRNGYAMLTGDVPDGLLATHEDLQIGLQTDTEVTLARSDGGPPGHLVTQAYCSALPIAYSSVAVGDVEPLARMVLNSAYEATLAAAVVNAARVEGSGMVYLTLLGGGVFGNPVEWIVDAIERAVSLHERVALDVAVVSFGQSNPDLARLLR